jgi:hypothetical protein
MYAVFFPLFATCGGHGVASYRGNSTPHKQNIKNR